MGVIAIQRAVPDPLADQMSRLAGLGFNLIPLGGSDGKQPLCQFAGNPPSLAQTLGLMRARGSMSYGIRLDGFVVVDADEASPEIDDLIADRFGQSTVQVSTPRGRHYWYRHDGGVPNLRAEGLPVDIKAGPRSYVLGPGSVRPDSGEYIAIKGQLGATELKALGVQRHQQSRPVQISAGGRHQALIKEAIHMVAFVDDPEELTANLTFIRDSQFEDPGSVSDTEVRAAADWAWKRRLENSLYAGRNSHFRLPRPALDRLKALTNASDAIALFTVLTDLHGHGVKPFALAWQSMRDAGHTDLPRRRFLTARDALIDAGVLMLVGNHRAGTRHQTFRLISSGVSSVSQDRGEGLLLTYVDQSGHGNSKNAFSGAKNSTKSMRQK